MPHRIAPSSFLQILAFAVGFAWPALVLAPHAAAQEGGIILLRDTETERLLKSYEDPILKVAGLDPQVVKIYLVKDPTMNSFVAEGQNIFVQSGMILGVNKPNELKGVLAHETGHIAGGHLSRDTDAIEKASVPMLLSMVLGIAAMAAGAGEAGMVLMGLGQDAAESQFLSFSRTQEATADQMGQKFLRETHQSGQGMLTVFEKFANDEAMASPVPAFARDHPASRDRVASLQVLVDASPYKDVQDSPADVHAFQMVQAKLSGYVDPVASVLTHYPPSDTGKPARYARAMAYFRKPDLPKALAEINSLIKDEPNNPYFYEVLGQFYFDMSQPEKAVAPYQRSVDLLPDAGQLRVALAAAEIATGRSDLAQTALDNLKIALQQENDDGFAWYEAAQAYDQLGNKPMADLATAERYYAAGAMPQAALFAARAQRGLISGSPEWEQASDIVAVAAQQIPHRR